MPLAISPRRPAPDDASHMISKSAIARLIFVPDIYILIGRCRICFFEHDDLFLLLVFFGWGVRTRKCVLASRTGHTYALHSRHRITERLSILRPKATQEYFAQSQLRYYIACICRELMRYFKVFMLMMTLSPSNFICFISKEVSFSEMLLVCFICTAKLLFF